MDSGNQAARQEDDMSAKVTVACIQNCATPDLEANLAETKAMTREAAAEGARLICLPEYFSCLDVENGRLKIPAFAEDRHPALPAYQALADELGAWILVGSLPIEAQGGSGGGNGGGKAVNRSYLLDDAGRIVARYDKIHLFDVDLAEGESYRESATIAPGGRAVVADTPWGRMGLSICYDLRFPQLYRALAQAGAEILSVPAAFTRTTGAAHWHILNRARAIENGAFVIAPCQNGVHAGGAATYGHSLIIDPWGEVLADGGEDSGVVLAELDMAAVAKARGMIPSLRHDRPFTLDAPGAVKAAE
jgi:predicted amidohydrolase